MDLTPDEIRLIEEHRQNQMPTWEPRQATSYTTVEKCVAFDRLHAMALDHLNKVKSERRPNSNARHHIYEDVMELLGKDVWTEYNRFLK